ncbi:MAG: DUF1850 domain-containing protein [Chloroflexota bacterium]|nr:DUF1850 domain-containing protein [Chloroflexota bacterium]
MVATMTAPWRRRLVAVSLPFALLLAPLVTAGLPERPAVVLRDVRTTDVLLCGTVAGVDVVTLDFTHSMYGGRVEETFRVAGETLVRTGVRAERAAAAEYYGTYGDVLAEDGWYRVVVTPLTIHDLRFVIDGIGQHAVKIGTTRWAESADTSPARHASLRVELVSTRQRRAWGC